MCLMLAVGLPASALTFFHMMYLRCLLLPTTCMKIKSSLPLREGSRQPLVCWAQGGCHTHYPSRSFEMAHCSRCRIDWLQRDGVLLLEVDRVLRPGGYFVYSSPEAYALDPFNRKIWRQMSDLARRMCWRVASKKNQTVIWAKPLTNGCYMRREPGTLPPMCERDGDSDADWGVPMKVCLTPYSKSKFIPFIFLQNTKYDNSVYCLVEFEFYIDYTCRKTHGAKTLLLRLPINCQPAQTHV
jgi:SAM-dependent methyltransferase